MCEICIKIFNKSEIAVSGENPGGARCLGGGWENFAVQGEAEPLGVGSNI